MKKKSICLLMALSLVLSSVLFQDGLAVSAKTKVTLSKTKVTINQGSLQKISVKKAKKATYSWKSKNKKVAKITKGAKKKTVTVKGIKKGKTTLICTVKQKGKKKLNLKATIIVKAKKSKPVKTKVPAKTPSTVTPKPAVPTKAPVTPTPVTPTQAPATPTPVAPTQAPVVPTQAPEDYSFTWDVPFDKDSQQSTQVVDNGNGTSTVTFPGNYSIIYFPLGENDEYDMSAYSKLLINLNTTSEIRISLFDSKGSNLKPPTSGTAEWSQWDYVGNGGKDGLCEIDITPIDRTKVAYVAISSCENTQPITISSMKLYAEDYRLSFDAQYAHPAVDNTGVIDNGNSTTTVNFTSVYQSIDFPLGENDSYNLSQYSKLLLNINCTEQFRVTLCDDKGNNIQPPVSEGAEWSQWWYLGQGGKDGEVECDLSALSKEDLAKTAYVRICSTETTYQPLTISGITFTGDARTEKYIPEEEETGPQDPLTENLKLTSSYSENNSTIYNNPLITYDYLADPTSIEYNGRLYVFGTNDVVEFDSKGIPINNAYNTHKIKIISSADLVNWRDEGVIDVSKLTSYATHSWAPTICKKEINGETKFFLYYTTGGDGIAVLEADSPTGEWSDPLGRTIVNHSTPNCSADKVPWCFDPSVLVDDDGSAYLYFGGGTETTSGTETNGEHPKSARVVKLGSDMISLDGTPQEMDPKWYFEDNEINKIGDTYYYSYCTNWSVTNDTTTESCCIAYMTSDNPMTGWEYQGQIFANPGTVFGNYYNNHHNMTKFKDNWYILYHTTILEEKQYGTKRGYRSLNIDKLNWSEGVPSATATYESVAQVGTFSPFNKINATEMAWNGGLSTTSVNTASGSAMVLDSIDTGDWFGVYKADFSTAVASKVTLSMAGTTTEGYIEVYLDAPSVEQGGQSIAKIDLTDTESIDTYQEVSADLSTSITGTHNIYFVLRGTGYRIANWMFN